MVRTISLSVLAATLCALQSGCCCCRLPLVMRGGAPVVFNAPPIIVNQPPVNVNPPPQDDKPFQQDNPIKGLPNQDQAKNPKEKAPNEDKAPKEVPPNAPPAGFVYNLRTGQLTLDNQPIGTGFSGTGAAKNNPALQNQLKTGPLPAGEWRILKAAKDFQTGEPIIDLHPLFGMKSRRGERFTMHPDTRINAGESGIAMPKAVCDSLKIGNFTKFKVVQ